jgi:hypothetical protein
VFFGLPGFLKSPKRIFSGLICACLHDQFFSKRREKTVKKRKEKPFQSRPGRKCRAVPLVFNLKNPKGNPENKISGTLALALHFHLGLECGETG